MNEKIRELARQSGGIDMTNHTAGSITTWIGTGTPEFLEKFANHILEECAARAEVYAHMSPNFNALAEEIRGMKS